MHEKIDEHSKTKLILLSLRLNVQIGFGILGAWMFTIVAVGRNKLSWHTPGGAQNCLVCKKRQKVLIQVLKQRGECEPECNNLRSNYRMQHKAQSQSLLGTLQKTEENRD